MFFRSRRKTKRAWTLVEMMVAVTVFSVSSAALATLFIFCIRSFASMANYASLDQENREALDMLTKEIRESRQVRDYLTNPPTIILLRGDGREVTYSFSSSTRQMTRTLAGEDPEVLLTNCNLLQFGLFQRNLTNALQPYDLGSNNVQKYVKAIELTWKTSKTLNPTTRINSENVQTARIVIRKQQE